MFDHGADSWSMTNSQYITTRSYGTFDMTHWNTGNPGDILLNVTSVSTNGGGVIKVTAGVGKQIMGLNLSMFFTERYEVAGNIPPELLTGVALGIYEDFSLKFEAWEGGFPIPQALESSYSTEDLPTHYLSFVAAANGWTRVEAFLKLGQIPMSGDKPARSMNPFWSGKNYEMTPRTQGADGQWQNVPWPDGVSIQPIPSSSGYWSQFPPPMFRPLE